MKKIILILCSTFIVFSISCKPNKQKVDSLKGILTVYTGDVTINGKKASFNQNIKKDDVIKTGKKSFCFLIINDNNSVRLSEDSSLKLTGDRTKTILFLKSGTLGSVVKKLQKLSSSYVIKTPTTVAAIKGTTFFIKVEDKNNTYFCDCYGSIDISDINMKNAQSLQATHHKAVRVTKENGTIKIKDAKMLYHMDQDMDKIAAKIGVKIRWK